MIEMNRCVSRATINSQSDCDADDVGGNLEGKKQREYNAGFRCALIKQSRGRRNKLDDDCFEDSIIAVGHIELPSHS